MLGCYGVSDVEGADGSTGGGDRSADLVAMSARQVILEERLARLEGEVRAGLAIFADFCSYVLSNGLSASFERIINEQRDHSYSVYQRSLQKIALRLTNRKLH